MSPARRARLAATGWGLVTAVCLVLCWQTASSPDPATPGTFVLVGATLLALRFLLRALDAVSATRPADPTNPKD